MKLQKVANQFSFRMEVCFCFRLANALELMQLNIAYAKNSYRTYEKTPIHVTREESLEELILI